MDLPEKHAFLVAVDKYDYSPLQFCEKDAQAVSSSLANFGFISPEVLPNASSKAVTERLTHYVERVRPGDTFLFYFAGHGVHQGANSYLLCADGRLDQPGGLTLAVVTQLLDRMPAAQKILICDACRTSVDLARNGEQPLEMTEQMFGEFEKLGARQLKLRSAQTTPLVEADWHVLLSCSQGERSWEDWSLQHGVFSHHLFTSLDRLARTTHLDEVSMAHVTSYVSTAVDGWNTRNPERKMRPFSIGSGAVKLKLRDIRSTAPSTGSSNWISVPAGEVVLQERKHKIEKFLVSSHLITVGAYAANSDLPINPPETNRNWAWRDRPITCVSWIDAINWCKKESATLPTEAQWEYPHKSESTGCRISSPTIRMVSGYIWHDCGLANGSRLRRTLVSKISRN